jgi:hypothetical protein
MDKRQVVLVCERHLWGESLEHILANASDVDFIGCWEFTEPVLSRLKAQPPDILVIASDEASSQNTVSLTAEVLDALPELTVLHATPSQNVLHIYISHTLPARQSELINIIRNLPLQSSKAAATLPGEETLMEDKK